MSDLRTAAQQALEALEWHYRQGHSNTLGGFRLKIDEKALRNLRAALAQEQDAELSAALGWPGGISNPVLDRVQLLQMVAALRVSAQQAQEKAEPLNLSDPSVRRRLAAQWGYVPAEQAEPAQEPVAVVATQSDVWRGYNGQWAPPGEPIKMVQMLRDLPKGTLLYTAPPRRKPLTDEEAAKACGASGNLGPLMQIVRAVERAHGIKE